MRLTLIPTRALKRIRRTIEHRLGFTIRRFPVAGTHARDLKDTMTSLGIDAVIDVGAHEGEFARFVRSQVGFGGQIVSFEPNPEAFRVLDAVATTDPNWLVRNCALGRETAVADLIVYSTSQFNSVRKVNELGQELLPTHTRPIDRLTIQIERLDQLYDPNWGERLFLKSDTQGNDLEVIDGASGIMNLVHGVQVEAGVLSIYEGAPDVLDVIERLKGLGFVPTSFHPVARYQDSRVAIEFDIMFIRALPEMHSLTLMSSDGRGSGPRTSSG